jgi:hypothetical protein
VLDVLSHGPLTPTDMRASIPAAWRGSAAALRILAAHRLVTTGDAGSWDSVQARDTAYRLTDRGRALVETLSGLSVWTTMLEGVEAHRSQ